MNGTRITLGLWSDANHGFGVESQTIILARGIDNRHVTNTTSPASVVLNTGVDNQAFVVSGLGDPVLSATTPSTIPRNAGSSVSWSSSTTLFGTEANIRSTTLKIGSTDFGSLVGFRYIALTDRLQSNSISTLVQPTNVPPPAIDTVSRNLS